MAALLQRKRGLKPAPSENSASVPQQSTDSASQSSNVLRRIKSSPLIRLVSTSPKKRDRDNEFPFPLVASPLHATTIYPSIASLKDDRGEDQAAPILPSTSAEMVTRPDLRARTQTALSLTTPEQSKLKVEGSPAEFSTNEVGLAITKPCETLRDSYVDASDAANANDESTQARNEQAPRHRSAAHAGDVGTHASLGLAQVGTAAHSSRESRRDLRPRGPRDIRNTLELFPKPRTTEVESYDDVRSTEFERHDLRRTSSPLLPLEASPVAEIPSKLDEISRLSVVQSDRIDLPAQKHHDEDAKILWSLQEGREADNMNVHSLKPAADSIRNDQLHDTNEGYGVRRNAPQEGTIEPQRSKSTSVSSSTRSSTIGRGQSFTSTARQSLSAASVTTHGSPPPQYLFTHPSKETARDLAEKTPEQISALRRPDEVPKRPQTAPEEDKRPRGGVKQRFPVVPRVHATGAQPYQTSLRLPPDRAVDVNSLPPIRTRTEPSLSKAVNPNYMVAGTPTFIRDGSFFRPLPPYPREQVEELSSRGTQTCSCSKALSPVSNLSIEELRAQNAMLRAALEAVIGP